MVGAVIHMKQTCSRSLTLWFKTEKAGDKERATEYPPHAFFSFLKKIINWFQG